MIRRHLAAILPWVALAVAAACVPAVAQTQAGYWDARQITDASFRSYNPQIGIDRWGNTHLMWATRDPRRAGLQLFYTCNISGRFAAPVQVSDTGTVFDSSQADFSSFRFLLDSAGVAHVAFVANVENHLRLYYTNNASGSFAPATYIAEQTRFTLAVDSLGRAHVVWVDVDAGWYNLHYWSNASPMEWMIGSFRCTAGSLCRVGDLEAEVSPRGVEVFLCADSASVYHTRWSFTDGAGTMTRLPIPAYDYWLTRAGRADLRMRAAVDTFGGIHIVMPRMAANRHRLLYASNAHGAWTWSWVTGDTLPATVLGFDVATNAADRMAIMWSTDSIAPRSLVPRIGLARYERANRRWTLAGVVNDVGAASGAPPMWRSGARVAVHGNTASLVGLSLPDTLREYVLWSYTHTGTRPSIAYLHPDAAAPGMNLVVEAIAPARELGSFGPDGFRRDTVSLRLVNARDSNRIVIGPSVVSWQGRMVSTMVYVRPGAAPGPVPIRVSVNGLQTTVDTFYVVRPQHLGDSTGILRGDGVLGSGGMYGVRSRRGVLVVDSLIIESGTWRIDTTDTDTETPGNQGFLPVTILSAGPVRIDSGAVLSVAATNDSTRTLFGAAGPGGGGGGSGGWIVAGSGYSGGGGPGGNNPVVIGASQSSGVMTAGGRFAGGPSLAGTPGGVGVPNGPGGGGLGHPFGAAGSHGRVSEYEPSVLDAGGFGGGTAGTRDLAFGAPTSGGGGAGFGSAGSTGNESGQESNGGWLVGARPLVPLAGGSGGGGGGYSSAGLGNGGGGGGALALIGFSTMTIAGHVSADGGNGAPGMATTNSSGGGGGAGGGIVISSKGPLVLTSTGRITALGGQGGRGYIVGGRDGGRGGDGRVRIDGRAASHPLSLSPAPGFRGPATGPNGDYIGREETIIRGTGEPGRRIRVFVRPDPGRWDYSRPRDVIVGADSTWSIKLGPDIGSGVVYVATMQAVDQPLRGVYAAEPDWVMSAAGANMVGRPFASISARGHDFGCIRLGDRDSVAVWVTNTGEISDLEISEVRVGGTGRLAFNVTVPINRVAPGDSVPILLSFAPGTVGRYNAILTIVTNASPEGTKDLAIAGCAVSGDLRLTPASIDVGALCAGACRDTVVRLTNVGTTTLRILEVSGDEGEIDVIALDGRTSWTIEPNESIDLPLRICIQSFDDSGLRIRFETDGETRRRDLTVLARNARPAPEFPDRIVFPELDLGRTPNACSERVFVLRNGRTDLPLLLRSASIVGDGAFTVLEAPIDQPIAPGASADVRLAFCAAAAGDYTARLRLIFDDEECRIDTTVELFGRASDGRAELTIIEPPHRLLQFTSTLIGGTSERLQVVVTNRGNVSARLAPPVLEVIGTETDPSEIVITDTATYPSELAPDARLVIYVEIRPLTVGRKEARMVFRSDDAVWADTVQIVGQGVQPGIQLVMTEHDYGSVRLGDTSAPFQVRVTNTGSAPDTITAILVRDAAHYLPTVTLPVPPVAVEPGDVVVIPFVYRPTSEQRDVSSIEFSVASGGALVARLTGRGVIERIVVQPNPVDFGPVRRNTVVDRPVAFRITNSGGYPLTVSSAGITEGTEWFEPIGDWSLPDTLNPGEARLFGVRYRGTHHDAKGRLVIRSSAGTVDVALRGSIEDEPVDVLLSAGDGAGLVGQFVEIPISIAFADSVAEQLSYEFTLTYDPGLLVARAGARGDAVSAPNIAGSVSAAAAWGAIQPGSVTIAGTIAPRAGSGLLVRIPMKVLMGPPVTTQLVVSNVRLLPGRFSIRTDAGTFTGVDCDTGLPVIARGRYGLSQNAPNPFNPITVIDYSVAARERVRITLYDGTGTVVRSLVDEVMDPGIYRLVIDSQEIGSGVYTYEMVSGPFRATRRMVVLE